MPPSLENGFFNTHQTTKGVFSMKKNVFLVVALLALMVAVLPAQTDDSGGTPGLKYILLKDGKGYSVEKGKVKTGVVVIPDSYNNLPVTTIAKKAFSSSTITGITIPNGVTSIGEEAFKSCKNLTGIIIPNSVTSIEKQTFDGCTSLKNITIPDSVTSIGEEAFDDCTSLTSVIIGNSVTSIGKQAFKGCKSLTSITIPNGVTSIELGTFEKCTSLTSVIIPNSVISIKGGAIMGGGAFNGCTSLTSITIPNSVTSIGNGAFSNTGLISVTIPDSVTSCEKSTFDNCKSLTAINVDAGNTAYSSQDGVWYDKNKTVLYRCPQGKAGAYTIPNGVISIDNWAFNGCKNIISVTIPSSVTSIGLQAFSGCISLTSVTFEGTIIPNNFNDRAFYGNGDLRGKYFWPELMGGGVGTYTRPIGGDKWTKQ